MSLWKALAAAAFLIASAIAPNTSFAETYIVQMLNKGPDGTRMAFVPAFLKATPGDTVRFVSVNKGHNVESIKGMLPDGADSWKGGFNKDVEVTLTQEGVYGYRCLPHCGLGMVSLIVVGDANVNLTTAKGVKHRGRKLKKAFKVLFGQIE